ncbi:MAG: hypothetical protein ACOVMI_03065 [Chitinophagaceae bacterium]
MKKMHTWPIAVLLLVTACCKCYELENNTVKTIHFSISTNEDFSTNNDSITFSLAIKQLNNQIIWDSTIPAMKIKDIPKQPLKINIAKQFHSSEITTLRVGVYYTIKNVGNAWYTDTFHTMNANKTLDFNFK